MSVFRSNLDSFFLFKPKEMLIHMVNHLLLSEGEGRKVEDSDVTGTVMVNRWVRAGVSNIRLAGRIRPANCFVFLRPARLFREI